MEKALDIQFSLFDETEYDCLQKWAWPQSVPCSTMDIVYNHIKATQI